MLHELYLERLAIREQIDWLETHIEEEDGPASQLLENALERLSAIQHSIDCCVFVDFLDGLDGLDIA